MSTSASSTVSADLGCTFCFLAAGFDAFLFIDVFSLAGAFLALDGFLGFAFDFDFTTLPAFLLALTALGAGLDSPKSFGLRRKPSIRWTRADFSPDRSRFRKTVRLRSSSACSLSSFSFKCSLAVPLNRRRLAFRLFALIFVCVC